MEKSRYIKNIRYNCQTIIDNLSMMLSELFDYVETEDEMKTHLKHYHRYYNTIKHDLKSEYVQCEIEKIVNRIEENLKHICHCYFINVTTFGFLGDSIFEAENSGLKGGWEVKVSTNTTIENYGATKLYIGQHQTNKK